jgi:hypothetical protein
MIRTEHRLWDVVETRSQEYGSMKGYVNLFSEFLGVPVSSD